MFSGFLNLCIFIPVIFPFISFDLILSVKNFGFSEALKFNKLESDIFFNDICTRFFRSVLFDVALSLGEITHAIISFLIVCPTLGKYTYEFSTSL